MAGKMVSVKCGHLSGTSRPYKVPSSTTVEELLEQVGFGDKFDTNRGDKVLDAKTMKEVDLDNKVKSGVEYIVSSDLKARSLWRQE